MSIIYEQPTIEKIGTINDLVLGKAEGDVNEAQPANETLKYYNPWS